MEASVEYLRPIPDRLFFRIGDVADIIGVKPYVLRFWETEFPMIAPNKSAAGHRVYRRVDVEMVMLIKHLLYQQRYSIEGARKKIREMRRLGLLKESLAELAAKLPLDEPRELRDVRELREVKADGDFDDESASRPPSGARQVDLALAAQLVRGEHHRQAAVSMATVNTPITAPATTTTPLTTLPSGVEPSPSTVSKIPKEVVGLIHELRDLSQTELRQFFKY